MFFYLLEDVKNNSNKISLSPHTLRWICAVVFDSVVATDDGLEAFLNALL